MDTFRKAALAAQFADEIKATDITLLEVTELCNFTDIFLICTGSNRVQLRAIAENIDARLRDFKCRAIRDEQKSDNWVVLDYGDVVVHIMNPETRALYRLESLWGDGKELDPAELLEETAAV